MNLQKDKDGFWLLDGQRLVVQTTRDEDGLSATGANISDVRFQELLEENSVVRAHNQLGEVIQVHLDMDGQSLVVISEEEIRSESVRILAEDLDRWLETAQRHPNILLGTRMIVLDKHDRAMSRNHDTKSGSFAFVAPDAELLGVTFLSPAQAMSVVAELTKKWPELGPFEAKDFQAYAIAEAHKLSQALTKLQSIAAAKAHTQSADRSERLEANPAVEQALTVTLSIDDTGNAAFADVGRNEEVARLIDMAAEKIYEQPPGMFRVGFALSDINGNRVGQVVVSEIRPEELISEGGVRLSIETGNAAFEDEPAGEVARIMRLAAESVRDGIDSFVLRDSNGNVVGNYTYNAPLSLESDGVIDMKKALAEGRVYLAEDGYEGIADGEFRFVVTTPDFEPGYGQGAGYAWLVNAKGEISSGNEKSPQQVRENTFDKMSREQLALLQDVVEGRVSFEDYERTFDNDPQLG